MNDEEIITTLSEMLITDETLYNHLSDSDKHLIDKRNASLKKAIDVITKYPKIEQIVKTWDDEENAMILADELREVIEDGNDG